MRSVTGGPPPPALVDWPSDPHAVSAAASTARKAADRFNVFMMTPSVKVRPKVGRTPFAAIVAGTRSPPRLTEAGHDVGRRRAVPQSAGGGCFLRVTPRR